MEKLIPVINKLQMIFNAADVDSVPVELPQIVVVGEQSSGKSSVLESLVGQPCLPRGINMVTRCPIVLQMIQMNPNCELYKAKAACLKSKKWFEFPHLPENEMTVTDSAKIFTIINDAVTLRAGNSGGISDQELVLRMFSPDVITLTIVDLPGIVRNPTGDQPSDIAAQVLALLKKYIENPNSIILAVHAGNNDIATSASIALAKTVDPNCERTIAVVTKLDLMDRGTDARDVLKGNVVQVRLGIIGVVNRSHEDILNNVDIATSISKEENFLRRNYPDIANVNGIPYLKIKLQNLLMHHIRMCLPELQSRLRNIQFRVRNDQEELGCDETADFSASDKKQLLLDIIVKFCNGYRATILGANRDIQKKGRNGAADINFEFEEHLVANIDAIDPLTGIEDEFILNTIGNSRALENSILILEAASQDIVREQIPHLLNPILLCSENVKTHMTKIKDMWMTKLEMDMKRFPNLAAAISLEVMQVIDERHIEAEELLRNYVEVQVCFIKTVREVFNSEVYQLTTTNAISKNELHPTHNIDGNVVLSSTNGDNSTHQNKQCWAVRDLIKAYFDIAKDAFKDYVPQAIAHAVVYHVEGNIHRHLIKTLYHPDKIDNLVKESEVTATRRREIVSQLNRLDEVFQMLRTINDTQF